MSRFYADEAIAVGASEVKTFNRDLVDNLGGSKANVARVSNWIQSGTEVAYRFGSDPVVTDPKQGHYLAPGETIEIVGYDNIVNAKFALAGHTPASLFVSYGT